MAQAQTVSAPFAADYALTNLGPVSSLPFPYGGLTFKAGDPNTILIGGNANTAAGLLYSIGVVRGADMHITGFSGSATAVGTVGAFNDGGVVYGPGGVLFTSQWPENKLGQTKPGSTGEDKVIDLTPLGVAGSHAALNFVPGGFGGALQMKLVSWGGGEFYTATYAPDGSGTFDITSITQVDLDSSTLAMDNLPGGPEGFVYITAGNPGFVANAMLVSEFTDGNVVAYDLDSEGNPLVATRRELVIGLAGAEGAAIDPLTGDFLLHLRDGRRPCGRAARFYQIAASLAGTSQRVALWSGASWPDAAAQQTSWPGSETGEIRPVGGARWRPTAVSRVG